MYDSYQNKSKECSVSLEVIDEAFEEVNRSSIELTRMLNAFTDKSEMKDAQNIITHTSMLIGYLISIRNQLIIYKRQASLTGSATAKDYLNELKVQMDGLKSITYAYGAIYSSLSDNKNLDAHR